MSQRLYIDQISKPVVTSWIEAHPDFLLEEDGDSFHEPGNSNIAWMWKESIGLKFYFNCQSSPVLAPIENCWQPVKQHIHKFPNWDDNFTKELIYEV